MKPANYQPADVPLGASKRGFPDWVITDGRSFESSLRSQAGFEPELTPPPAG